jgi:hypothetical protein
MEETATVVLFLGLVCVLFFVLVPPVERIYRVAKGQCQHTSSACTGAEASLVASS